MGTGSLDLEAVDYECNERKQSRTSVRSNGCRIEIIAEKVDWEGKVESRERAPLLFSCPASAMGGRSQMIFVSTLGIASSGKESVSDYVGCNYWSSGDGGELGDEKEVQMRYASPFIVAVETVWQMHE